MREKKRKKEKIHVEELASLKLGNRSPISGNALSDVEEVLSWIGSRGMELYRSLASLDGDITLIILLGRNHPRLRRSHPSEIDY